MQDDTHAKVEMALKQVAEQGAQNVDEPCDDEDVQREAMRVQHLCRGHVTAAATVSSAAATATVSSAALNQTSGGATPEERTPLSIGMVPMTGQATFAQESDLAELDLRGWESGKVEFFTRDSCISTHQYTRDT